MNERTRNRRVGAAPVRKRFPSFGAGGAKPLPHGRGSDRRRRAGTTAAIVGLVVVFGLIAGAVVVIKSDASGGGKGQAARGDIFVAKRGGFDVTIIASGELTALNQIEIRNPLEDQAVITWIVPEGERVKKGDVLIRFADEEIRAEIKDDELEVLTAQMEVTSAENELAIQESLNASRLSQAKVDVEIAKLALDQWREEDKSKREQLRIALDTSQKNYDRLRERYQDSLDLEKKGFISKDEVKRDEIAMIEAEADVKVKRLEIDVYTNFQSQREQKEFESDLDRKREELGRVEQQNAAELAQALERLKTRQGQLEIQQDRLEEERIQFSKTVVTAPQDGLVVYASSMESGGWRGDERSPPQIGTELRRNDFVISLPDTSEMVASVKVHESLTGRINPGQRARVVSDLLPNTVLRGEVISVGVLAETGGWRDPNRRDYTVRLLLDDVAGLGLKPSIACQAEIFVDSVEDATHVPVQAVFHDGPVAFVYTPASGGYVQHPVKIGRASEVYVEILEGIEPGDRVLTREPKETEIVAKLSIPEDVRRKWEEETRQRREAERAARAEQEARMGARRGGGDPAALMAQFDTNGDGKLQREEAPAQMSGFFDRLDLNGDGEIDTAEIEQARQQFRGGPDGERGDPGERSDGERRRGGDENRSEDSDNEQRSNDDTAQQGQQES